MLCLLSKPACDGVKPQMPVRQAHPLLSPLIIRMPEMLYQFSVFQDSVQLVHITEREF